ncbi:hypothetical protein DPMN_145665 [Dreissena polymorpha]|uniref:Uncharacterized protein n=1 Tax=Dreissena polymorpha TaxID=45954 RepID=A0A9D4F4H0_DREPO|nr:hypothetical protein DPMN_145665 [Dreissena polymorpha]
MTLPLCIQHCLTQIKFIPQPSPKDATGGDTTVFFRNSLTSWNARGPRRGPDRNPK